MVLTHTHKSYEIIQLVRQSRISGGSENVFVLAPFMKFLYSVKYHLTEREGTPWDSPSKRYSWDAPVSLLIHTSHCLTLLSPIFTDHQEPTIPAALFWKWVDGKKEWQHSEKRTQKWGTAWFWPTLCLLCCDNSPALDRDGAEWRQQPHTARNSKRTDYTGLINHLNQNKICVH